MAVIGNNSSNSDSVINNIKHRINSDNNNNKMVLSAHLTLQSPDSTLQ